MNELSLTELDEQHAAVLPVREEMLLDFGAITALNNVTALNNISAPVSVGAVSVPVSVPVVVIAPISGS